MNYSDLKTPSFHCRNRFFDGQTAANMAWFPPLSERVHYRAFSTILFQGKNQLNCALVMTRAQQGVVEPGPDRGAVV